MARRPPQHWLLFAGPVDTGLAVQLEPVMSKNGAPLSFTPGPIGEHFEIYLETGEDDNTPATDIYRDLGNSARNGGECGYTLLQSEDDLRCEVTSRFQFEEKYLNSDVLRNISGASADLLFGLAVVTAARKDLEYRPFAATGILTEEGQVLAIEGLRAKIDAALDIPALCGKGLIFYPKVNEGDIDAELRHRLEQAQIDLKPVERLEEAVECLGIPIQGTWLGNPYRRLDVFESSHRRIYFGRENEATNLAEKLFERAEEDRPSLLILGPSGGGKSSLVQAGLIPELEERFKDHALSPLFSVFDLRSAANKDVDAIAASIRSAWSLLPGLAALAVKSSEQQTTSPSFDPFAVLISDLISYLPDQTSFVWVLDQLEQFFTLGLSEEADAAFIRFLRELQARGIWIVATFRNDFYSSLQAHDGILSIFGKDGTHDKDGIHDLEKLSETAIERIIQKPAKLAKVEFEYDDQKSELLSLKLKNDALGGGKDILPLLEFALDQLYQKRELKNGRTQMTWAAYGAMGGLHGAIGNRADEVLHSLDESAQEALGRVLRALAKLRRDSVQTEGGKSSFIASAVDAEQFPSGTPARRLIDAFADARLFVRDRDNQGIAQVRVTHESLFTHWSKADVILKGSMKDMRIRDRLIDSEAHWKTNKEDVSLLVPSGLPLEEAQGLLTRMRDELKPEIVRYIEQSGIADQERKLKELETQQRKTRFAIIIAVVLGVLLFVAAVAAYLAEQREKELAQTLARSDFNEGVRLVEQGKSREALAYFTRVMRLDSGIDTAAARLAASLLLSPNYRININTIFFRCQDMKEGIHLDVNMRWILTVCGKTFRIGKIDIEARRFPSMKHYDSFQLSQISPSRHWVVTAFQNRAQVWDANTGESVSRPIVHENLIRTVEFSPDGRWVVTASQDNTAQVWDAATGRPVSQPLLHEAFVNSAQFSPDGRWVVTASQDNTAQVWDVATGASLSLPMQHQEHVNSAQFSPDGRWVVTASSDNTARVWDAATGMPISKPMEHSGAVTSVQFSPDSRWVVTASEDRTARIWDAASGIPISQPMEHDAKVTSAQFSSDSRSVITASWSDTLRVWDVSTGIPMSQPIQHKDSIHFAQFSPDGRWIGTASWDNTARVWDAATGMPISKPMEHGGTVTSIQFSPDSRWVVTASWDNTTRVWDAASGMLQSQSMEHGYGPIISAEFSPNGRWVVTASSDNTSRVWDAASGASISQPMEHDDAVFSARFSPNGRWVVTASSDNTSRVWNAATGTPLSQLMIHNDLVGAAQFSPDSRWVVTASWDNTARVWDASTGNPVSQPIRHEHQVNSAQFSPDGRWVLTTSGDKTARVWDAASGAPISQPMKHDDAVYSARFSPNGRWVVTASSDNTARVWEAVTGSPASVPYEHRNSVQFAEFNPEGNKILTVTHDAFRFLEVAYFTKISKGMIEFLERISGYYINTKSPIFRNYEISTKSELRNWAVAADLIQEEREFINWWLSDPIERTITPYNKQTVKEHIQMLIDRNTIMSLNEALDYHPGHPIALAKLAAATWREAKTDQQDDIRARVALWANLALKYAPDDIAVREVAEKVLQDIAQPN
ncbi:WD40 repeat [Nitrosomonas ureae]|uniref:WD40 repeat n=2 Tax=Nitrosomonas ureae TaxID=44577 RepID=A0A1H9FHC1_9PROT|nr:WD40 repeat [Nitrosomonas ureae]